MLIDIPVPSGGTEDGREAAKVKRNAENDQRLAAMVGSIFCYSWGYEQTNIEFFQVTAMKNRKLTLREIASDLQSSPGFSSMSGHCTPCRDQFIGEEFTKLVTPWGISMPHGCCAPTNDTDKHYCSWYA
jgi:hypothetical protein